VSFLIDLVFEDVSESQAEMLCKRLVGEEGPALVAMAGSAETGLANVKLDTFRVSEDVVLGYTLVTVRRYDGHLDVELDFELGEAKAPSQRHVQDALHAFAMSVANEVSAQTYYAGMDPAHDEETRLFTNTIVGPMMLS